MNLVRSDCIYEIKEHGLGVLLECPHCDLARVRELHQREDLARINGELAAAQDEARKRARREWVFWLAIIALALGFAWAVAR
jgi:hypothetical protein